MDPASPWVSPVEPFERRPDEPFERRPEVEAALAWPRRGPKCQTRPALLIVTGTKRSGTSMWMQILIAAGYPPFGEAFPSDWGQTLRQANPGGFYESLLRQGIYWRTNPHPRTGAYFFPEQVERHVVKVFIPGLVRSDRAYIGRVIATVRSWREYLRSLARLHTMEDEARRAQSPLAPAPVRFPPALEWWSENFALVRDIAIRRYPVHVQSYDGLLADPDAVIRKTLAWLGDADLGLDIEAAVAAVDADHRTQHSEPGTDPSLGSDTGVSAAQSFAAQPEFEEFFDELFAVFHAGRGLDRSFVQALNAVNQRLIPHIQAAQTAVHNDRLERQARRRQDGDDGNSSESLPPGSMDWR